MQLDTAKTAGLLVIGAIAALALLRKGFGSVTVHVGD